MSKKEKDKSSSQDEVGNAEERPEGEQSTIQKIEELLKKDGFEENINPLDTLDRGIRTYTKKSEWDFQIVEILCWRK